MAGAGRWWWRGRPGEGAGLREGGGREREGGREGEGRGGGGEEEG